MKISEETIEQIKIQTDIVEVISEDIMLKKKGRNFVGLCPFHDDKNPSFYVSIDKQIYKCFSCGKAGNVITFLKEYHGMHFIDAIKLLADKLHIDLKLDDDKSVHQKLNRNEKAYSASRFAAEFFNRILKSNSGKKAYEYLIERNFTDETIDKFMLGYSPDSWDKTALELKQQGFDDEVLKDTGMVVEKDKGGYYDRFRGRLMFPIKDQLGRVVAFGARYLGNEKNQAKYINSSQSLIYDKSRILYGLFESKNKIRKRSSAIIVEGYADVIMLHQNDIKNCVASSGTALTEQQLRILARYTRKIYFAFDSDSAGVQATDRGIELALINNFDVRIIIMPEGEDPDSITRQHGKTGFLLLLKSSIDFIDFKIRLFNSEHKKPSPAEASKFVHDMINLITIIPDRLQHDIYVKKLMNFNHLNDKMIESIYQEKIRIEKNADRKKITGMSFVQNKEVKTNAAVEIINQLDPIEFEIIKTMLDDPGSLESILNNYKLTSEDMITETGKSLFELIRHIADETNSIIDWVISRNDISNDDREVLTLISMQGEEPSDSWEDYVTDYPEKNYDKKIRDTYFRLLIDRLESEKNDILDKLKLTQDLDENNYILLKEEIKRSRMIEDYKKRLSSNQD